MTRPTVYMMVRQIVGRALRETGQALDRLGIMGHQHAVTTRIIGDDPYRFDDHLSRHRLYMPLLQRGAPVVSPHVAFVAPNATLIGSVRVGPGASVWYGAILRADSCENAQHFYNYNNDDNANTIWHLDPDRFQIHKFHKNRDLGGGIFIGANSNVQDHCLITAKLHHVVIGDGVTIGHAAHIHSATIQSHCLIGMGAKILPHVTVHHESLVAAGAVVPPGTSVGPGELYVSSRQRRPLTHDERQALHHQAREYVKVATGQQRVMELGGNLPESLIQHVMIHGGEQTETTNDKEQETERRTEQLQLRLEEPVKIKP